MKQLNNMQIRKANESDISDIVALLKASLGNVVPKSENYWIWKHQHNPFGQSYVLLVEEGDRLIGVRAFMRWKWKNQHVEYSSVRAVDTATHPDFQGRGIFSKLTLTALEELESDVNFVYNTPNEKSMHGYLKMAWIEQGRMPVKLSLNPWKLKKTSEPLILADWSLVDFSIFAQQQTPLLQTFYSPKYLKWRYIDNPIISYDYLTDGYSFLVIFRYKPHHWGVEFRITDIFIRKEKFSSKTKRDLYKQMQAKSKQVFLTTVSARQLAAVDDLFPGFGFFPAFNQGPIITLRNLNLESGLFQQIKQVDRWAFSFGDMELF
jgi:GNAT superfamily N-acetyltransferase